MSTQSNMVKIAVVGGEVSSARSESQPATIERSSGIRRPRSDTALSTPTNSDMPPAMIAVGRSGPSSMNEVVRKHCSATKLSVWSIRGSNGMPLAARPSL